MSSGFKVAAVLTGLVSVALSGVAGGAEAQTRSRQSTPFVIHAGVTAGPEVGVDSAAPPGQPLIVQRATSIRAARLETDTPSLAGFKKVKTFAAGSPMFGVYSDTGWAYCAVAETTAAWWAGDEFVCYEDADADGRFETAMHSGAPFLGVPLFVFELGRKQALPAPAPYSLQDTAEGPGVDYVLSARVNRHQNRDTPEIPAVVTVTVTGGFRKGVNAVPTPIGGWADTVRVNPGETARISVMGVEIDILGVDDDNTVRYRLVETPPSQVQRITMGVTTRTTYTPIMIPG